MKAFEGLKVVDFTQVISGPVATQMFALLGANVIKIEPLGKGDEMRTLLTDPEMAARFLSPGFMTNNMGKRSLALDLKSAQDKAIAHKLIDEADVVVENFRPGVAKRLGIDYDSIKSRNPNVVYCSISGYGQKGPKSTDGAYDTAIQADAGLMALTGNDETGPLRAGFLAVDMYTGMSAAFAISSALYRRQATGAGQFVDVAMYDSALMMGCTQMSDFLVRATFSHVPATNRPLDNLPAEASKPPTAWFCWWPLLKRSRKKRLEFWGWSICWMTHFTPHTTHAATM
jgi:formyl-CoA transferase